MFSNQFNQKINYDLKMQQQINNLNGKKKLLLHSCCGPCSTACIEKLIKYFDVTIFYYNPNIYPHEEFDKRLVNQEKVLKHFIGVKIVVPDYDEQIFLQNVKGLESQAEGGLRCEECFKLRLKQTAIYAKLNGYDYFGTTLTVSSHKDEQKINQIGLKIANETNVNFLFADFKKHDGYKRSVDLSHEYGLYRQNYCGCRFSIKKVN